MDSLITAAARALAAGDPLGALNRVALRDDAPALYRSADLVLFPSRFEPLGNVVIQSWAHGVPVIIMHNRASVDATVNIVDDMRRWFERAIAIAHAAGIRDASILLDPGIGFGKTPEQNFDAIVAVRELRALGYPVVVGTSRKSFIGQITGTAHDPTARLFGTIASNVAAESHGASGGSLRNSR